MQVLTMRGTGQSIPPMRPGFNPASAARELSDIQPGSALVCAMQWSRRPPGYWRQRAKDARERIAGLHDPLAQQSLERIAIGYEALARSAERLTERRLGPLPDKRLC
jgi:hypothetical protein